MNSHKFARIAAASLMAGASITALGTAAEAKRILFTTSDAVPKGEIAPGQEIALPGGTTQVLLANGGIASFVDAARFSLREDGSIDLREGAVTAVSASGATVEVHMPEGVKGAVFGEGSSASFVTGPKGSKGAVVRGQVTITGAAGSETYAAGQFWAAENGRPDRVVTAGVQNAPEAGSVRSTRTGGIAAAAANGVPIALGDALQAAGAAGDIVAAARRVEAYDANPTLAAFPVGDYSFLSDYAARAAAAYGGSSFPGAGGDIVLAYFQYLAGGGRPGDFRSAYAAMLLDYLALVRSGALPSGFDGASQAQLSAYLAYLGRIDGFGGLSADNRALIDAYLAFLAGGGQADGFAANVSGLIGAYLDFLRTGGDPDDFTHVSGALVAQYLALIRSSGFIDQLSTQNRALLEAYLAEIDGGGSGLGFQARYAAALAAFVAHLEAGGLPSGYNAVDAAGLRRYLEVLAAAGLFDQTLGGNADFLRGYLAWLEDGGEPDAYPGLPNVDLDAYASALSGFVAWLRAGNLPSSYAGLTEAQVRSYLIALSVSGQLDTLMGTHAELLQAYLAWLQDGGAPDQFADLPIVVMTAYASALNAFYAHLAAGGLPSGYGQLTQAEVRAYLEALAAAGLADSLIGANATFFAAYLAWVQGGGSPDLYAGLPAFPLYLTVIQDFYAYVAAGGEPSGYTVINLDQLLAYIQALDAAGVLATGISNTDMLAFFRGYATYLAGGGDPDDYAGLPGDGGTTPTPTPEPTPGIAVGERTGQHTLVANYANTNATYSSAPGNKVVYDEDGVIRSYTNYLGSTFNQANARVPIAERGSIDGAIGWARFTGQTANGAQTEAQGWHVVSGTPATNLPTSGKVDYHLIGATRPTAGEGEVAAGRFTGDLAVDFATRRVGFDFDVTMGDYGWDIRTSGGAADPGTGGMSLSINNQISGNPLISGTTASSCLQQCTINVNGFLYGPAASHFGLAYGLTDRLSTSSLLRVSGVAAFANQAPTGPTGVTYQGWADALRSYHAYLIGGGLPSDYSTLTQQQIVAFIEALDDAGIIVDELEDEDAQFVLDYAAWVAGGNDPDDFAGLPANATSTVDVRVAYALNKPGSGNDVFAALGSQPVEVNADGKPTEALPLNTTIVYTEGAEMVEGARSGDVAVGRLTNFTYTGSGGQFTVGPNQGVHFAFAPPLAAVPTTGKLLYDLAVATSPTFVDGGTAPGSFDGQIVIAYAPGAVRTAAEGSVTMLGDATYSFATAGGLDGVDALSPRTIATWDFLQLNAPMTGTGRACQTGANCRLYLVVVPGGTGATSLAVSYEGRSDSAADIPFAGAAGFTLTGPYTPAPPAPTGGTETGQRLSAFAGMGAVDFGPVGDTGSAIYDNEGKLSAYDSFLLGRVNRNTARAAEAGRAAGVIGWSRWTEGSTDKANLGPYTANQGLHVLTGKATAAAQMPASGTVTYSQIGGTKPTLASGAAAPGSLTGQMSVAFGSLPKVGLDLTMAVGNLGWRYQSEGGVANPSQSSLTVNGFGQFGRQGLAVTGTTAASCQSSCHGAGSVSGQFYGPGASHAGVYFGVLDTGAGAAQAGGLAIFAKP